MSEGYTISIRALINGVHVKIERFSYDREGSIEVTAPNIETVWEMLPRWVAKWESRIGKQPTAEDLDRKFLEPVWEE